MSDPRVRLERDGAIATIVLDRPEKLNALDAGMIAGLEACLVAIEQDRDIRAVILTGSGKAFSVGGDAEVAGERKFEP
ncbi:MAG: enoyl-CoA hydratase/isomerase family protein, partial [Chloroflexota bacterium]